MEKKEKERLLKALYSTNDQSILNALETIEKKGSSVFTKPMIELLKTTQNKDLKTKVLQMFRHLKNQTAGEIIADSLPDINAGEIQKELVSACWMNGLDYSGKLNIFVEVFSNQKFETAFEAYTVITNTPLEKLSEVELSALYEKAKKCLHDSSELKQNTAEDLCEYFYRGI
ncbi:MAG: hypothetical protein U9N85_01600 [Bacteroidota bacterium]|nr:hypothetical protein [Bacteroidota bacterium]